MIKCRKRNTKKSDSEFYKSATHKSGVSTVCRACESVRHKKDRMKNKLKTAYSDQKSNARMRGIGFNISFEEWLDIWVSSGHLQDRGRGSKKYCMARIGDLGNYEIGNVYISTGRDNVSLGNIGREPSLEVRKKIRDANKGKPHPWSVGEKNVMHRSDVKKKISDATKEGRHYRASKMITPFGEFNSGTEAARILNMDKGTLYYRCKSDNFPEWQQLAIA